jgi:hypothetical protein
MGTHYPQFRRRGGGEVSSLRSKGVKKLKELKTIEKLYYYEKDII